jgi:hypothetical protein
MAMNVNVPFNKYDIDTDFPLMYDIAKRVDDNEKMGFNNSPLNVEIEAAMRELWMARSNNRAER